MRTFLALAVLCGLAVPAVAADKPKRDPAEMFAKLDKNGDKKIDMTEFLGKKDGDKAAAAKKSFEAKDKDKDGFLSLEEFSAAGKKAKK